MSVCVCLCSRASIHFIHEFHVSKGTFSIVGKSAKMTIEGLTTCIYLSLCTQSSYRSLYDHGHRASIETECCCWQYKDTYCLYNPSGMTIKGFVLCWLQIAGHFMGDGFVTDMRIIGLGDKKAVEEDLLTTNSVHNEIHSGSQLTVVASIHCRLLYFPLGGKVEALTTCMKSHRFFSLHYVFYIGHAKETQNINDERRVGYFICL